MVRKRRRILTPAVTVGLLWYGAAASAEPLSFSVRIDPALAPPVMAGRLFVFLSRNVRSEPQFGPDWFHPEPFFARDVPRWEPGAAIRLDDQADGFPGPLSQLPHSTYRVQAVLHCDAESPSPAGGVGDLYSSALLTTLDASAGGPLELVLSQVNRVPAFPESAWYREVALRSPRLSTFHGRDVYHRAAVALPPSYQRQPQRRFPVIYLVSGFGGSIRANEWAHASGPRPVAADEAEFIRVILDGQCGWGHHVYANSATNGPRGDALVEELIPYIDAHYRTVAAPTARFVSGHSSGGWAALWLQVNYPDAFGGVWSLAPDPVDFRDFQRIDLYADPPQNMYYDPQGQPRPIARDGTTPVLWYPSFGRMDDCLGRGGQLRSFEAVFSPRGADGLPRKLWDRRSGAIDAETARAWRKYDLRLLLAERWPTLGPKLQGKLHIACGSLDTFYLDGAVVLLGETLRQLGSDAEVEIDPGKNHGTLLTRERMARIRRQMTAVFARHHPREAAFLQPESVLAR